MIQSSFEFFPPKNHAMNQRLWISIQQLSMLRPKFVSVTYGAGGSTRDLTHDTVKRIVNDTDLTAAAHLTCVGATKQQVLSVAKDYWAAGVNHIVALRGDPPAGMGEKFQPHPNGFADSVELVHSLRTEAIKQGIDLDISVACYPELHPESRGWAEEIQYLKRKQDAGANQTITQFFFEPNVYKNFVDRARSSGVTMPIIPGIMLQPNYQSLSRIASLCGASIPIWMSTLYNNLADDPKLYEDTTVKIAVNICESLIEFGVNHFHFYTLNHADLALRTHNLLKTNNEF
jgi:methylenetetrahydrofolate reductase (NADPH)